MTVAVVLLTTALVIVVALLAAAGAGKLARMDDATYPTALTRAAATFAAVITLAAAVRRPPHLKVMCWQVTYSTTPTELPTCQTSRKASDLHRTREH